MFKPSGVTLALVCAAMILFVAQSASLMNELNIDNKGNIGHMTAEAHEHVDLNDDLEANDFSARGRRRRTLPVTKAKVWEQFCTTCGGGAAGWDEQRIDGCRAFTYLENGEEQFDLPAWAKYDPGAKYGEEGNYQPHCIYPHAGVRGRIALGMGPEADNGETKREKACSCLTKLIDTCKTTQCTTDWLHKCNGLCGKFQQRLKGSALVQKNLQNQSATLDRKVMIRREAEVDEHSDGDQILMQRGASSESKHESGSLDETLQDKC